MIYLPTDLFTPFIQGREYGIDRNWNDLNQSNKVQEGWLNNDAQQLKNWFTQDTYGDNISNSNAGARINQNKATGSDLNTQIALAGQPGAVAQAGSASDYQQALANASRPNIPTIAGNQAQYQLGQSVDNAARGNALVQYAQPLRTAQVQNDLTTTQNNATVLGNQNELFPVQQQTAILNNQAQQHALTNYIDQSQNGSLFPQQQGGVVAAPVTTVASPATSVVNPMQATQAPIDPQSVFNVAARLTPGQEGQINVNGQAVTAGRDQQGVYYVANGQKQYIAQPAQTTQSQLFSFGSK